MLSSPTMKELRIFEILQLIAGMAGAMAVLRYRNITIVHANNKSVFHALNDICSVGGGLVSAVVDNWHYQHLQVFKIKFR